MWAREPDESGFVSCGGVRLHYEVHGCGGPTLLLLPTWTIIHKRFWKMQLHYLSRHFRVVTYDGPGNGLSDRPLEPAVYDHVAQVEYALAVLDTTGSDHACLVSLSLGSHWALDLAANHRERVIGAVFICPSANLTDPHEDRAAHMDVAAPSPVGLPLSRVPLGGEDPASHWAKYNLAYWSDRHDDFLWFFFGKCFPESRSSKPIEDCVTWGLETTPEVLVAEHRGEAQPDRATLEAWCARTSCPVLVIHGDHDLISPLARGRRLADLTGGELITIEGGGHIPLARDPVRVNLELRAFADRLEPPRNRRRSWRRTPRRRKRALFVSSPIGLGHVRRDLAIATELRRHHPELEIDWLAQHPVTRVLQDAGERIHPASRWLASETAHIERESGEHTLHCFQALRRMDEILLANFHVFHELVSTEPYHLVIGDEAWEIDHFLHENPELKRFAYAWLTDFVGYLPMPGGGDREEYLVADYNAEMIEHVERYPRLRDRAVFIGDPADIVPHRFGPALPRIGEWTEANYEFAGFVNGFDHTAVPDTESLRAELGYRPGEQVCIATVGGSGVGGDLLRRIAAAFPAARNRVAALRMVVVTGPRIDPSSLPEHPGLEVRGYMPELYRHLACCDLAIVQGGLTTCMELTAASRPFIFIPLRQHFEQNLHVEHRLRRYGAGRRLEFDVATPELIAGVIAEEIGRNVRYRPVETDGAARAAETIAELL
jgi:pimeloyl-ACP methyl ester carboxylesterase/predicted glycosyltransferase